ncbi:SirA family protein [Kiloniella spongiae]|uniref:SirA family protein n=1 Tax=Kiloniella spongiae TaxID=1489064 RepID=A0A0H2MHL4_9PROT|nr:sulfurtransferase TusA family protein [Kiloniella spongiae]KLN60227.1 SirA family protein [Kiloniella spongiae]
MSDHFLDATGLKCPIPVLRARKAMKPLAINDVLEIHATDPSAELDFKSFCETTGYELISFQEQGDVLVMQIRKQ